MVQRVVLGVPFVGADREAQEVRAVLGGVVDADLAVRGHLFPGREAAGERGVAPGVGGQRPHGDRFGVGVSRAAVLQRAVLQAAELQHRPGLEDEQVEELLGVAFLGLRPARGAAVPGDREEGDRHPVGPLGGGADRLPGLGDEEERRDDVDQREAERARGLRVAALHERLPHRPDPGDRDGEDEPGRAEDARVERVDRLRHRPERSRAPGRIRAVDQVETEGEGEQRDQQVRQEARQRPEDRGEGEGDHRRHTRGVHAAGQRGRDRVEVLVEHVVAEREAAVEAVGAQRRGGADVGPHVACRARERVGEQDEPGAQPEHGGCPARPPLVKDAPHACAAFGVLSSAASSSGKTRST